MTHTQTHTGPLQPIFIYTVTKQRTAVRNKCTHACTQRAFSLMWASTLTLRSDPDEGLKFSFSPPLKRRCCQSGWHNQDDSPLQTATLYLPGRDKQFSISLLSHAQAHTLPRTPFNNTGQALQMREIWQTIGAKRWIIQSKLFL